MSENNMVANDIEGLEEIIKAEYEERKNDISFTIQKYADAEHLKLSQQLVNVSQNLHDLVKKLQNTGEEGERIMEKLGKLKEQMDTIGSNVEGTKATTAQLAGSMDKATSPGSYASVLSNVEEASSIFPSASASNTGSTKTRTPNNIPQPSPLASKPGITVDTSRIKDKVDVTNPNVAVTSTEEEAAKLRVKDNRMGQAFQGARWEEWYPIKVDGVCMEAVLIPNTRNIIPEFGGRFCGDNKVEQVMKASWISRPEKPVGSIIVYLSQQEDAQSLLKRGQVIVGGRLANVDTYVPQSRPIRCGKCHRYGHLLFECTNHITCGECSGAHNTSACTSTTKKCPACRGPHSIWYPGCPAYLEQKRRARETRRVPPRNAITAGRGGSLSRFSSIPETLPVQWNAGDQRAFAEYTRTHTLQPVNVLPLQHLHFQQRSSPGPW